MYKEIFDKKKVIIFDLDGTLVASLKAWNLALLEVLGQLNIPNVQTQATNASVGAYVGERIKYIIDREGNPSRIPLTELIKFANDSFLKIVESSPDFVVRDGFFVLAQALRERGKQLVLATNTDKYVADRMCELLHIDGMFDFFIAGDMVKKRKPDPEIYHSVQRHFGVTNSQCLVFEDSIAGIEAARRAKMDTIAIYDPLSEVDTQEYPDTVLFYLDDFTTLPYNLDTTPQQVLEEARKALEAQEKELGLEKINPEDYTNTPIDPMQEAPNQEVQ